MLWMALPQTNGAQIIFRSFLEPVFARYFQGHGASANLKAQAQKTM